MTDEESCMRVADTPSIAVEPERQVSADPCDKCGDIYGYWDKKRGQFIRRLGFCMRCYRAFMRKNPCLSAIESRKKVHRVERRKKSMSETPKGVMTEGEKSRMRIQDYIKEYHECEKEWARIKSWDPDFVFEDV